MGDGDVQGSVAVQVSPDGGGVKGEDTRCKKCINGAIKLQRQLMSV